MQKTSLVAALFLGVLVAALLARYFMTLAPPKAKEGFVQKEFSSISGPGMGPYDQVNMPGVSGWASTEAAPAGTSPAAENSNIMFLADTKTSPSCCPSAFNTDTGCVCLSSSERSLMATRGGNRAAA
jgi:hypothetical protein